MLHDVPEKKRKEKKLMSAIKPQLQNQDKRLIHFSLK